MSRWEMITSAYHLAPLSSKYQIWYDVMYSAQCDYILVQWVTIEASFNWFFLLLCLSVLCSIGLLATS